MNSRIPQDFGCFSGSLGLWVSMIDLEFLSTHMCMFFIVIIFVMAIYFLENLMGIYPAVRLFFLLDGNAQLG